jgi:hypothetical protein
MNHLSKIHNTIDFFILTTIVIFISTFIDARLIFWDTILSGGDSISWYQIAGYLKEALIPKARLYGWDMANFCGYPNFNFYFIPPFLLAVLISYLGFPLTIGLKIVMVSGWYILPISVYFGVRFMSCQFPAPIIGACATLLFLFNESYTMFGGNILSTLAGEFCYMFAFSLLPFFMGSMIKGFSNDKRIIINGLLLGLIGLSHLFVFIPAISVLLYGFFTKKRTVYLIQVSAIGFGVMAFWILPLIAWRNAYTVPVYMIWQHFVSLKIGVMTSVALLVVLVPTIVFQIMPVGKYSVRHENSLMPHIKIVFGILCLLIILALLIFGLLYNIGTEIQILSLSKFFGWILLTGLTVWLVCIVFISPMGQTACKNFCEKTQEIGVLLWMTGVCICMYCCAHFLKVPDIRFLPPILLILIILIFSFYLGQYLSSFTWGIQLMTILFILICIFATIVLKEKNVQNWYTDTFKGYEHTRGVDHFKQLIQYLKTEDALNAPRIGYEKSSRYGPYGGDRIFESLYMFSGRQTLEGIHYSSSLASKFITFLQTEFSKEIKTPTPYVLSQINPESLSIHMQLYNISQLIIISPAVKKIFEKAPQFIHKKDIGQFSIFRLNNKLPGYVSTLTCPPVLYTGNDWLNQFYDQWFKYPEKTDVLFVPSYFVKHPDDRAVFQEKTSQITVLHEFVEKKYQYETNIQCHLSHFKIQFRTSAVGVPHLIRVSYFPNWKVSGAHGVYPVSPHFMLVIPRSEEVTLIYSRCLWEIIGWCLTGFTFFALLLTRIWKNNPMVHFFKCLALFLEKPLNGCRPVLFCLIILCGVVFSILGVINRNIPVRTYLDGNAHYTHGIKLKKQMALKEADVSFLKAIDSMAHLFDQADKYDHQDIMNCLLLTASCYTELKKFDLAHEQYDRIINDYPYSRYIAESYVQKSRLSRKYRDLNMNAGLRSNDPENGFLKRALLQTQQSIAYLKRAITLDPYSNWAVTATTELQNEMRILNQINSSNRRLQLRHFDSIKY